MMTRIVALVVPWQLEHGSVGSSRYWYVRHAPSGLLAASFDGAPCPDKVADVKAAFLAMVADWPDLTGMDPRAMTPAQIERVKGFQNLLTRTDCRTYRVTK